MKLILVLAIVFVTASGQSEQFVSSGFGDKVKLYELYESGRLKFVLENKMPSAIEHYVLQTCVTGPRGVMCPCTIRSEANISADSKAPLASECVLPVDPQTGKTFPHSSRIVALRLANGWKWQRPVSVSIPLHRAPKRQP